MPCDSIITTQIDLSNADHNVLASALAELGLTVTENTSERIQARSLNGSSVTWVKGRGTTINASRRETGLADRIAPAYSQAALKTVSKKNGWSWRQDKKNANMFTVSKR